jgi:PAS domain S-box-containing protein
MTARASNSGRLMTFRQAATLRRSAVQCFLGTIALALVTLACFRLEAGLATTAFVYLIVIVLLSLRGSFFVSAILSIVAVVALNYFFSPPIFNFRVDYPLDVVLVVAFLLTSLIVTGLVGRVLQQTEAALAAQARAEQAESEMRLAIDTIPALVWRTQPDGFCDFVNQPWLDYAGLSADQAVGWGWASAIHPDDVAAMLDDWRTIRASGTRGEVEARLRRFDGEFRSFLFRAEPLRGKADNVVKWYGTSIDIEERKRAEVALRESEQRFRDYAELGSDWLWEDGPDHRLTRVSVQLASAGIDSQLRPGATRWELATDAEGDPEKWRLHIATLQMRKPFRDFRYATTRANGSALYVARSGKPVFDPAGNFLGYRGVSHDRTAEVRTEQAEEALRLAQVELAHVTRVTMLGQLSASIAHEVNQPLAAIVTNAQACLRWLGREAPDLDEARGTVERIGKEGARAAEVIRRVRALSHKTDIEKVPLDINSVVNDVAALLQRELLRHRVPLRMELSPELPMVLADRVQLQQVIINLVMNGIEAMHLVADRPRDLAIGSHLDDAHHVRVTVKDCGAGITDEDERTGCSPPSSPPSPAAWAWDSRSAARSWKRTADDCGPRAMLARGRPSSSPCRPMATRPSNRRCRSERHDRPAGREAVLAQKYVWSGNRDADDCDRHFLVMRIGPRVKLRPGHHGRALGAKGFGRQVVGHNNARLPNRRACIVVPRC